MNVFGFSSSQVIAAVVTAFFALVAFDGERALDKLDAVYDATQDNTKNIGLNKAAVDLLILANNDHETRIRVLEHDNYTKKPTSIPTVWPEPLIKPDDISYVDVTKF